MYDAHTQGDCDRAIGGLPKLQGGPRAPGTAGQLPMHKNSAPGPLAGPTAANWRSQGGVAHLATLPQPPPPPGLPPPLATPQARGPSTLQAWQLQRNHNALGSWSAGGRRRLPQLPPPPGPPHPAACRRGVPGPAPQWWRPLLASTSPCWWPLSGPQAWHRWRDRWRCAGVLPGGWVQAGACKAAAPHTALLSICGCE